MLLNMTLIKKDDADNDNNAYDDIDDHHLHATLLLSILIYDIHYNQM